MKNPIVERPWLAIIATLAVFAAAWVAILVVVHRYQPAEVPVPRAAAAP